MRQWLFAPVLMYTAMVWPALLPHANAVAEYPPSIGNAVGQSLLPVGGIR